MVAVPGGRASRAVKRIAAAVDTVRRPGRGVVVLAYHRVGGGSESSVDLDRGLFEEQMAMVASEAAPVSIDDGLRALEAAERPARDPIVLTFDDGTADFAEQALPVLVAHRLPVTVYVATEFVETGAAFTTGAPMLSWGALRDAVSTGLVTVGSHTHSHALLDHASQDVATDELDRSIQLIEERLDVPVRHFAYPKARMGSPAADVAVRSRFDSAALSGTRANRYGRTDPYQLSRSPIQQADGTEWFRRKLRGGLRLEGDLRRVLDARRYRGAVT